MSVFIRSRFMRSSEQPREKAERNEDRHRGGNRRKLFLAVPPSEILDDQNAQAAEQMHGEQKHQAGFGELDQRLIGPAQEAVKSRGAVDGETERQKMERQKNRERKTGKPVH